MMRFLVPLSSPPCSSWRPLDRRSPARTARSRPRSCGTSSRSSPARRRPTAPTSAATSEATPTTRVVEVPGEDGMATAELIALIIGASGIGAIAAHFALRTAGRASARRRATAAPVQTSAAEAARHAQPRGPRTGSPSSAARRARECRIELSRRLDFGGSARRSSSLEQRLEREREEKQQLERGLEQEREEKQQLERGLEQEQAQRAEAQQKQQDAERTRRAAPAAAAAASPVRSRAQPRPPRHPERGRPAIHAAPVACCPRVLAGPPNDRTRHGRSRRAPRALAGRCAITPRETTARCRHVSSARRRLRAGWRARRSSSSSALQARTRCDRRTRSRRSSTSSPPPGGTRPGRGARRGSCSSNCRPGRSCAMPARRAHELADLGLDDRERERQP